MKQLLDQVATHRRQIKHETVTFSLAEIVRMFHEEPKEVELQPSYQRLFRWGRQQQTDFIESLILDIPIPPLFVFEREDGRWEVLDGLQRFSTVVKFLGQGDEDVPEEARGFPNTEAQWHYDNQNNLDAPSQLTAGEYLSCLDGLTFVRLPTQLQLNLKRTRLQLAVLKRETDPLYKFEVFKRLNRGGTKLTEQELRNCSIRLLDSATADFIQCLGGMSEFQELIEFNEDKVNSMGPQELALRYLAMKNKPDFFKHDVSEFLDKYLEAVAKKEVDIDFDKEKALLRRTSNVLLRANYRGMEFRQVTENGNKMGPFSPTVFELVMLAVAGNIDAYEDHAQTIKEPLEELVSKAKDEGLFGGGSNSKKKTLGRVALAQDWRP